MWPACRHVDEGRTQHVAVLPEVTRQTGECLRVAGRGQDARGGLPQPSRRRNLTRDSLESTESFGTRTNVRWLVWGDGVSAGVTQPFGGTHVSDPQEPRPRRDRGGGRAGFHPRPTPCARGPGPRAPGPAVAGRPGGPPPGGAPGGGVPGGA